MTIHETVLSASEAVSYLGMSLPTLVRSLESGEIPLQPGNKVRLADVLAYREVVRRRRAEGLDRMVADAEEAGFYDIPESSFAMWNRC